MLFVIQDTFFHQSFLCYFLLALSGILGIGMGDSYWFMSCQMIGPRITLLFELLNPLMTFILSSIFLDQAQTLQAWIGMFIAVFGIYMVIFQEEEEKLAKSRRGDVSGITSNDESQAGLLK